MKAVPALPTVQHTNPLKPEFYEGGFVHEVTVIRQWDAQISNPALWKKRVGCLCDKEMGMDTWGRAEGETEAEMGKWKHWVGVVVRACSPNTRGIEAGGSRLFQDSLHSELLGGKVLSQNKQQTSK